eukprot:GAHX01002109.1.p1 GENE.GAHX01002109.1~~GAHX01002109.1.p1  ORF type:complete len:341 (-),score=73.79 GAHX01002109.1:52-1014(-)
MHLSQQQTTRRYEKPHTNLKTFVGKPNKSIILFDYDGTLTPIVNDPSNALLTKKSFNTIKGFLSTNNPLVFAIVSGRDEVSLQTLLTTNGNDLQELSAITQNFFISSSHGSRLTNYKTKETSHWDSKVDVASLEANIRKLIKENGLSSGYNLRLEIKESSICVHYRPKPEEEESKEGQNRALLAYNKLKPSLEQLTKNKFGSLHVKEGKMVFELIYKRVSKSEAIKAILIKTSEMYPKNTMDEKDNSEINVICAGDDKTDYDMFRELKKIENDTNYKNELGLDNITLNVLNIKVGEEVDKSLEDIRVGTVDEFMELLKNV